MAAAQDLFDPELYREVRLPFEQAKSMPPWCYTSPAFFEREVERIFRRVWNFAGRADEVRNPGDYFTLDMFGESVIIVRGRDHDSAPSPTPAVTAAPACSRDEATAG